MYTTELIKVANWIWLKPKRLERLLKQQGLTGTPYKLFFGDIKEFTSMRSQALENPMTAFCHDYFPRVEPFRHHLATNFGIKDFIWFGPMPMSTISKLELIKEAWTKTHEIQKVRVNPIFDKLFPGLVSYGEKWAKHRQIINPAFQLQNLKLMLPAFRDSCAEIMNRWEKLVVETGSVELDAWPDITKLSADVISRAAFGSNYKKGQKIFELLKEQTELTHLRLQSVNFPGRRHIPTARNRRFKEVEAQIHTALAAIIKGKEIGMSLENVIDEYKLFYLAGQETTSTLLVWNLILLSKHQDWQAQAREEVLHTFGDNVQTLKVTMTLHEVFRLYPPVMQLTRHVCKDTKLGALSVPSGALITFFVHNIHRHQEIWGDDAHEFKPDRGKFFNTEAKIALAMILQCFSFELSPSYIQAPETVIFLQPQHGAHIVLHKV
ncbi:hypothetical protein RDABS01_037157 [Bienertia sinuspersici]